MAKNMTTHESHSSFSSHAPLHSLPRYASSLADDKRKTESKSLQDNNRHPDPVSDEARTTKQFMEGNGGVMRSRHDRSSVAPSRQSGSTLSPQYYMKPIMNSVATSFSGSPTYLSPKAPTIDRAHALLNVFENMETRGVASAEIVMLMAGDVERLNSAARMMFPNLKSMDLNGIAYMCSAARVVATELVNDELNQDAKLSMLASGAMRLAKAIEVSDSARAWKSVAYAEWTVLEEVVRIWTRKQGEKQE